MKQPIQYRQGDVLLVRIDNDDTEGYVEVPRDAGRVVLAYGEATGHAHAIYDDGATSLLAYMHCGGLVGPTFVLMGVGGGLLLGDRE